MPDWLLDVSAWVIPVILAITLHEAAHGYVAERYGDDTARNAGRVTFNPIKHIDRFGTIVFPGLLMLMQAPFLFGYAKPVPVNFQQLSPPRKGMFMVAIAGVVVNFFLAITAGLLLHIEAWISPEQAPWLFMNLYRALMINAVLIVFNMLPILPLDGGRAVDALLPDGARFYFRKIERYGILIVLGVLLVPLLFDFSPAQYIVGEPALWLVEQILWLTGNGGA
ncbi:MAG: site-2 protease family protein [Rickettsiales bacterium]